MEFRRLVGWAKGHRTGLAVAALILIFAGVDLLVNVPEDPSERWFSAPILAGGFFLLVLLVWPTAKPGPQAQRDTMAHRLLWWATWGGRLVPAFPAFGVGLIVADIAYNRFASSTPALLENDLVVLFFGAALVAYRFVPPRFERERDFVLLFLAVLVLVLVVPLLIMRALIGDPYRSVNAYSSLALAPETGAFLNLLGVPNSILYDSSGAPGLAFDTAAGTHVVVYISTACSGIYSLAIFASAFTAFVFTEQRRLTKRVLAFFALGVALAYLANVLRMVVIVLVGYHFDSQQTGIQSMLIAHNNAGWLIFLGWVALFWALLFRFLPREAPGPEETEAVPHRRGTFCGICGIVLTPAIPATQCVCGKLYHAECLAGEGRCPNCEAPSSPYPAVDHTVT